MLKHLTTVSTEEENSLYSKVIHHYSLCQTLGMFWNSEFFEFPNRS